MNEDYIKALYGKLCSEPSSQKMTVQVYNKLVMTVIVYSLDTNGRRQPLGVIYAGQNAELPNAVAGNAYVFTNNLTGSFVSAVKLPAGHDELPIVLNTEILAKPNDIGPLPSTEVSGLVPVNSPLVLVAAGPVVGMSNPRNRIFREQFWQVQGDSYTLAPKESRTVSYTVVTGVQSTSSEQVTIATSVNATAHAGWGPISASISASVSGAASVFQQVSINEQTTTFVSDTITNNDPTKTRQIVRWQLMDVITVFTNEGGAPEASMITGLNPVIVDVSPYKNPAKSATKTRRKTTKRSAK